MNILKKILANGYIPILPILIWNLVFYSKLPAKYAPESFNNNIPQIIAIGELIFRTIIFIFPLVFIINITLSTGKKGLFIYLLGSFLYYLSWLLLIYFPTSEWSKSVIGFAAPAYLPIIWLIGISLMTEKYYFKSKYKIWHFLIPSILFSIFHITHTLYVFWRN